MLSNTIIQPIYEIISSFCFINMSYRNKTEIQHTYLDPYDIQGIVATGNQEARQLSVLGSTQKTHGDRNPSVPPTQSPLYEECDDNHDELGYMALVQAKSSASSTGYMAIGSSDEKEVGLHPKLIKQSRKICMIEHVELL